MNVLTGRDGQLELLGMIRPAKVRFPASSETDDHGRRPRRESLVAAPKYPDELRERAVRL